METDDQNTVLKEFVKNHIALYNYSVSSASNDSIVLMNGKNVVLKSDAVGEVKLLTKNQVYKNGVLYTIGSQIDYLPNIFEYIAKDAELDSVRSFLYNSKYYYKEFLPGESVVDSVRNGQTVYMDSVFKQRNRLFSQLDYINEEDSTFWMVLPTNTVWKGLIDEYSNYFKYAKNVEYRDSLEYTNSRLSILQGTVFSRTVNKGVFEKKAASGSSVVDSAMSTNAVLSYQFRSSNWGGNFNYYEYLNAWSPNGVFTLSPATVECSNGMVRKATTKWPIDKLETFFRYRIIQAEGNNIWEVSKVVDSNKDSITTITPNVRSAAKTVRDYRDMVWGGRFVEFTPTESTVNHFATFMIKNVISGYVSEAGDTLGGYDIYMVTAPAIAYDENATDTLPTVMRCTLSYPDKDGKTKSAKQVTVTTRVHQMDYFLLYENFTFPVTNYGLSEDKPSVQLKVETRVSNGQVRDGIYTRTMRIDCILLVPHGTLLTDMSPDRVYLLPHGNYNGDNLRWWYMDR